LYGLKHRKLLQKRNFIIQKHQQDSSISGGLFLDEKNSSDDDYLSLSKAWGNDMNNYNHHHSTQIKYTSGFEFGMAKP
jgi:hypothetical protein